MEIDKIIKNTFDEMCGCYVKTFKQYYPARGSAGFTERNLTFNFCRSLDIKDSIILQEHPFPKEESDNSFSFKEHIDSVIILPKDKTVLYIEAKRLKNKSSRNSIVDDVARLNKWKDKSDNMRGDEKWPGLKKDIQEYGNVKIEKEYLLVLADVWLERKKSNGESSRLAVPRWFLGEEKSKTLYEKCKKYYKNQNPSRDIPEFSFEESFQGKTSLDWNMNHKAFFDEKDFYSECLKTYCLMMAFTKI